MKAAVGRSGGVVSMRCTARGSPWTALPLASTAALVGAQVRAKHYISYRLEGEDDPYRHLRRCKSPSKKKQSRQQPQHDEELLMGEAKEEASSSSLASFLFGPTTQHDEEVNRSPVEAATSQRDAEVASGLGAGGGVVHRSKGAMPSRRPSVEGGVGGQLTGGAAGQGPQPQTPRERGGGGEDRGSAESRAMMADRPRVEGEDHEPVFWVKETGKKVLERVGGAAASVGHTAKQLWVGALKRVSAQPDHHHGLVDKAKDVGKGTVHVVDTGYEKTIEKAADKMLEALDASLKSAKARGFPPGLTVTTIASVMGAQLMMAYTTKEEDVKTESGRKDANITRPKQQSRKTAQPRQRKESEKSKKGSGHLAQEQR
ncbi:uncharacterized protein ACA1_277540 [Acanthamoeba castellanii str. Neff]|uniref:Senescence domain-containing protein n=1 Tax=Acanthamoeba castellanii (strain ATCC 30010 / Neff) TaxID=1257118 RepID=L8H6Q7_ACACF|nr:uncharacterized protein ACA1_277540 [Acanthamoeba castellanii str. Neff]ELR20835.1 hypothetical protein ACA1_277540 [Acanthamoeba castellanii str. Neff]